MAISEYNQTEKYNELYIPLTEEANSELKNAQDIIEDEREKFREYEKEYSSYVNQSIRSNTITSIVWVVTAILSISFIVIAIYNVDFRIKSKNNEEKD